MNNLEKVGCEASFEGVHVLQTVGIQKYFQNILLMNLNLFYGVHL